ncbi:unnamed protein product [Acanthoscelides obtectus]|uniref:Uncharacterized protein n=1 Tax=Acanthoscelides obtectus TaxID=200917 RepID=A0A9P0ME87_ACAOB|nr:unnamed protein product [Acanthoscelides obtectus]CAK1688193.1 hypothetical protein AOBTE_LOCUS36596 [Acanthoscelides obtectus]
MIITGRNVGRIWRVRKRFPAEFGNFFSGHFCGMRLGVILQGYHFLPIDQRRLFLDESYLYSL